MTLEEEEITEVGVAAVEGIDAGKVDFELVSGTAVVTRSGAESVLFRMLLLFCC